jgi:hypothetical protein
MIIYFGRESCLERNLSQFQFAIRNSTWFALGSNPAHRNEEPMTNRQNVLPSFENLH